jgi:hypothetical protein
MMTGMATDKITITLDRETLSHARELAKSAGVSLSAWLDKAARARARDELLRRLDEGPYPQIQQTEQHQWLDLAEAERSAIWPAPDNRGEAAG